MKGGTGVIPMDAEVTKEAEGWERNRNFASVLRSNQVKAAAACPLKPKVTDSKVVAH